MYKNSFYSLGIALIIPLVLYGILYTSTYKKIQMPPKQFVDSIITKIEKGKTIYDTIFHKVQEHLPVINYRNNEPMDLSNLWHDQITLLYLTNNSDSFTYRNLKKLATLKKQLKIDSFINILCFTNTSLPDSFLLSEIQFLVTKDTALHNFFFYNELRMNTHNEILPLVVLIDRERIVRNYYLLNHLNEEQFLLDIILLNLEK